MIQRVYRRATILTEGLRDVWYAERLAQTGLISVEKRRVRGDLIQVYKILKGWENSIIHFCLKSQQMEEQGS